MTLRERIAGAESADIILLAIPAGLIVFAAETHLGTVCISGLGVSYLSLMLALFVLPFKWHNND